MSLKKETIMKRLGVTEEQFQEMVQQEKDKLINPTFDYDSMTLDEAKYVKVEKELNQKCNLTIISGFDYTINGVSYRFYLPLEAQANFQGAYARFRAGKMTNVRWTVFNHDTQQFERIDLDWATFEPIADEVFNIIDNNVRKLRDDLEITVKLATTIEEIKSVTW